jgi:hypothetical protein
MKFNTGDTVRILKTGNTGVIIKLSKQSTSEHVRYQVRPDNDIAITLGYWEENLELVERRRFREGERVVINNSMVSGTIYAVEKADNETCEKYVVKRDDNGCLVYWYTNNDLRLEVTTNNGNIKTRQRIVKSNKSRADVPAYRG